MKKLVLMVFLCWSSALWGQTPEPPRTGSNIGVGLGIDYGGIGMRGTWHPIEKWGLLCGLGYNLAGVGTNVGVQKHFPVGRNSFYITALYGYNAVIQISGTMNDTGTYYGVSAGIGYQLTRRHDNNFWNFELLLPFRSENFKKDLDTLKTVGATLTEPYPIAISVGFHFAWGEN